MIKAITMPKWGLSMTEGLVGDWLVAEGAAVQSGTEVVLVETEKIAGGVEVAGAGTVRRAVAATGDTLPVGALLGVLADAETPDADVDAFITQFQDNFVPEETGAEESVDQTETDPGRRTVDQLPAAGIDAAKTAVLLHGFGGDLNNWLFNQPALIARPHGDCAGPAGTRADHQESGQRQHAVPGTHPAEHDGKARRCRGRLGRPLHGRGDCPATGAVAARPGPFADPARQRRPRSRDQHRISAGFHPPAATAANSSRTFGSCLPTSRWSPANWSRTCSSTSGSTACRNPWRRWRTNSATTALRPRRRAK